MKLPVTKSSRDQKGTAVLVVIALLAIVLVFVTGNLRALHLLRNDLRIVEAQQTNRLARVELVTNASPPAPFKTEREPVPGSPAPK